MVCGFLGTLIGVERAVALGAFWPYAAPLLTAVGTLALLAGLPAPPLMTLGSLGLVAIFAVIVRRQCALATVTMALGALLWLVGNGCWLAGLASGAGRAVVERLPGADHCRGAPGVEPFAAAVCACTTCCFCWQ